MTQLDAQRREDINIKSLVHARGWSGIFNAFKGKDDAPVQAIELIPFPDDFDSKKRTISHETERILFRLIQEKRLSVKAIAFAIKDNEHLKEALKP